MASQTSDNDLSPLHNKAQKGLWGFWIGIFKSFRSHSFLLKKLVSVNIINAYKKSFIGLSWLILTPIISVIVWILLNRAGIMNPGETGIPYPAFVLLSTSIWAFFQGSYQVTSQVIVNSGRFLVTAKFPHELLIGEQLIVHSINFVVPFVINIIVLLIYDVQFHTVAILFPVSLIPLLLLGSAIGMVVSLLRVVAVDLSRLADQCMLFLMFITPIVYSPKVELAWLAEIIKYNPLTYLVGFSRDLLITGTFTNINGFIVCSIFSFVSFLVCFRIFMRSEGKLLERLINV